MKSSMKVDQNDVTILYKIQNFNKKYNFLEDEVV